MFNNIDIIKEIFHNLDLEYQIYFIQINKQFNKLKIIDLYNIKYKYLEKLNDNILQIYKDCERLYAKDNKNVKNINHLTNLKILNCVGHCGVSDEDIQNLDLITLKCSYNEKITKINHMKNLKNLECQYHGNLNNDGVVGLDLKKLNILHNNNINININQFTNLKSLCCGYLSGTYDLKSLNLKSLFAYNVHIKNINHMTNLELLDCGGYISNVNDDDLKNLNLTKLYMDDNMIIKNISHMDNLRILSCNNTNINDNSIKNLNLINLKCSTNKNITNVEHMTNLKMLNYIKIKK